MADEADISQAESDFLLSVILRKRAQYQGESAEYCTSCGEVIPAVRRRALPGVRYCVFCAEYNERTGTR
ncbi:TraR/DksA C4-type zinc finger protein (plasmid) [Morganella morganii]|uniref:TraR/DksA C4-type zinc finger protein n=1 Tax=Morganella morganii TaxID=582 RepID=UPI0028D4B8FB|nr:TraR/DksA C4-type zinc finger protein [Morganella morganii]WNP32620.1 TraR/DksA C4-type zinc finger protein [Morganella morganii]